MKVFYHKSYDYRTVPTRLESESNMLALSYNNWNDYGVNTTLNAVLYFEDKVSFEFSLKLLIENEQNSPNKMNELCEQGWDGFFPIPDLNYVSIPNDINFYDALIGTIGKEAAHEILVLIKDAGYFRNILKDEKAINLTEHEDFTTSPLREGGAHKAYLDGWKLFNEEFSSIQDFRLNTINKDGTIEPIDFSFNSDHLPYDINVLIGENGIGKSFTLKSLVEYWLGVDSGSKKSLEDNNHTPFDNYPNIAKLILISYSPFEEFTIDLSNTTLRNKEAYKYFGFRKVIENEDGNQRIGISRNLPASDSVESIIKSITDDIQFDFMPDWKSKFDTILSVLQPAIEFDFIAFEILKDIETLAGIPLFLNYIFHEDKKYLRIDKPLFVILGDSQININDYINSQAGAIFIKGENKIELSSGQRLFCYIVVNVVGQIKKDSLVVIDEPELFLHPTLEIEFIALLKIVLEAFNSKAILATHSLTISREVPANCIHVYHKRNDRVEIAHPPFETFGGDMQRISSYVFGDNSVTKPFDDWIDEKLKINPNPDQLIENLGSEINEEILIKILNSGDKNGG